MKRLVDEERAISYRRCVIQGRIDVIRVDPVQHDVVSHSPRELAHTLMGGEMRSGEGF